MVVNMKQKMLNTVRRFVIYIIVVGLLVGMSSSAGAGVNVIFEDNFDSYVTGSFPSSGGWNLKYNGIGTSYQIVDNSQSTSSQNSLKLEGQANWAATADHTLSIIADQVVYESDIKVTQPGNTVMNYPDAQITLANPNVNTWGTHYASVRFGNEENRIIYLTGSNATMPYNFNQWYHVKTSVANINKDYSVWIDGTFLGSGTFSSTGDYSVIRLIGGNNAHTRVWFDNVKVYQENTDTTLPIISIISPADGTTFDTSSILIDGTASDNIALNKVEVKVNSGNWQLASGTNSWSKSVTLSSGSNTIYTRATDTSGNTADASITVTYTPPDTVLPFISISSHSSGMSFTTNTITISGSASDNIALSKVEVKVNSGNWQLASGTNLWSKTLTLNSGSNTINARATDASGNLKESSLIVSYSLPTTTPTTTISPTPTPSTGTITISTTPSGASIYLDGSYQGKTPKLMSYVSTGNHNIELKLEGYETWSDRISIVSGSNSISTPLFIKGTPTPSPSITTTTKQKTDININLNNTNQNIQAIENQNSKLDVFKYAGIGVVAVLLLGIFKYSSRKNETKVIIGKVGNSADHVVNDNSTKTNVDNRDGIIQRSNIGGKVNIHEKLTDLKEAFEKGLISEDVYKKKQEELLDKL